MNDAVLNRIREAADRVYGRSWQPEAFVSAPGRIELIGNHLDYNGGPVLAAAINRRIVVAARPNATGQISATFSDIEPAGKSPVMVASGGLVRDMTAGTHPENFLIGAIQALDAANTPRHLGMELVVASDLPYGVGISSSAALCVSLVAALATEPLDKMQHVALARDAEHRTGSPCGAMDQSASVFGDIIRFDGRDLSVAPITADLGEYEFILANSNVIRELGASSYPIRVREVREAVVVLNQHGWPGISYLADINAADMNDAAVQLERLGHPNLARRTRHVVSETARSIAAETNLQHEDWVSFGRHMNAAGRSSALDYEISHPDVEELVAACLENTGVLGARMMGGGEGGSVLALIRKSQRDAIIGHLEDRFYRARGGPSAEESVIACAFDRGVSVTQA